MANFLQQLPTNFRAFSVSASTSSNGCPPSVPQYGGPVILELPLDKIRRPLMRTRANDPQKVKELMKSISEIGLQIPVFLVAIDMKLTSSWGYQLYVAKFVVGQRKL